MHSELAPASALCDGIVSNFIGGKWAPSASNEVDTDTDPARPSRELALVARSGREDAANALAVAAEAQREWGSQSPIARGQILLGGARVIRSRADKIASALTAEEGKPLGEAIAEVTRAAELLEATAGLAYAAHGEVFGRRRREQWLLTEHVPLGVVVVIAPWNFPFLIPAWKIAPALLAGNTVVFKPAGLTPLTAVHLVDALADAGTPPGVLNLVLGPGGELADALIQAPAAAVTFTGGNEAGAAVARLATERHLKFQLELGGNNPVLVLADADVDLAVREIVAGATSSTGQKCTATRRVFIASPLAAELSQRLREALGQVRLGPGSDRRTTVGPLVSAAAQSDFLDAIGRIDGVATTERFGRAPDEGFFVEPVLAMSGDPDDRLFADEIFGPLVSVFEVDGLADGIERCNATRFGLSASVFTSSVSAALAFADGVEAGMVHVNSQTTGAEPHIPFGGMKHSSSYSREVGRHGFEFFSQVKTVYLEGA